MLKSRILLGCLATPLASQKEVHLMDLLSKERSSGGWCLLGKVVTIKISRQLNISKFEFSLHFISTASGALVVGGVRDICIDV